LEVRKGAYFAAFSAAAAADVLVPADGSRSLPTWAAVQAMVEACSAHTVAAREIATQDAAAAATAAAAAAAQAVDAAAGAVGGDCLAVVAEVAHRLVQVYAAAPIDRRDEVEAALLDVLQGAARLTVARVTTVAFSQWKLRDDGTLEEVVARPAAEVVLTGDAVVTAVLRYRAQRFGGATLLHAAAHSLCVPLFRHCAHLLSDDDVLAVAPGGPLSMLSVNVVGMLELGVLAGLAKAPGAGERLRAAQRDITAVLRRATPWAVELTQLFSPWAWLARLPAWDNMPPMPKLCVRGAEPAAVAPVVTAAAAAAAAATSSNELVFWLPQTGDLEPLLLNGAHDIGVALRHALVLIAAVEQAMRLCTVLAAGGSGGDKAPPPSPWVLQLCGGGKLDLGDGGAGGAAATTSA